MRFRDALMESAARSPGWFSKIATASELLAIDDDYLIFAAQVASEGDVLDAVERVWELSATEGRLLSKWIAIIAIARNIEAMPDPWRFLFTTFREIEHVRFECRKCQTAIGLSVERERRNAAKREKAEQHQKRLFLQARRSRERAYRLGQLDGLAPCERLQRIARESDRPLFSFPSEYADVDNITLYQLDIATLQDLAQITSVIRRGAWRQLNARVREVLRTKSMKR